MGSARCSIWTRLRESAGLIGTLILICSPAIARAFLGLQTVEARDSSLTPRLREVIILAAAGGCRGIGTPHSRD